MKNLGSQTEINLTNRMQGKEGRISDFDNTIEEVYTPVKENVKSKKIPNTERTSRKSGTPLEDQF